MELNISSLMDVLTILLIFLIMSYDSNKTEVTAPKDGFTLPDSVAEKKIVPAIKLSVGPDRISVEDVEVIRLNSGKIPTGALGSDGNITKLVAQLQLRMKDNIETINEEDEEEREILYLEAAEDLPYEVVEKAMKSAAAAGFTKFRLAVHRI